MRVVLAAFVVSALALAACGKADPAEAAKTCGPLEVTVAGKKVDLPHAYAIFEKASSGWLVEAFNHDKVTCEQMLASAREIEDGEVAARAYVTDSGGMPAVGLGAHTQMMIDAVLVKKAAKVGDDVSICIPNPVKFTPRIGDHKDQEVTVKGLFTGKHCGER